MSKKILYIGAVMVDVLCPAPRLPERGGCLVLEHREMSLGGCAYNSARITQQLDGACDLFVPIGQGPYAGYVRDVLGQLGFEGFEVESLGDCGACLCLVEPDGERTMLTLPGVERCFESSWFAQINASKYDTLVVNGFEVEGKSGEPILSFLEKNDSLQVVYAPGPRVLDVPRAYTQRIEDLHPIWHLNEQEAIAFTGAKNLEEAGESFLARGAGAVVVTAGDKGSWAFTQKGNFFAPSKAVEVVDTIGAGDSHLGAALAARQEGRNWKETLEIANRVAALVCAQAGANLNAQQIASLK